MDINKMIKEQLNDYAGIKPDTKVETAAQIEHVPVAISDISNTDDNDYANVICSSTYSGLSESRKYDIYDGPVSCYRELTIFDTIEEHVENMDTDEKINFIQTVLDRTGMTDAFIDYMRKEGMI